MQQKALLIVMDGWGHGQIRAADAIADADTPFVRSLYHQYPNTELTTFGEAVGLPEGQMGNSEVGHLTIGAGRVIKQELPRINEALTNGELEHSPVLKAAFDHVLQEGTTLHLMGLVSDGGVHSHINHLIALCELAQKAGVANVAVHAFTDGRDTDPESGIGFLHTLLPVLEQSGAKLATLTGRYYAMDRDKRWDRVKLAYDAMTLGVGTKMTDALEAIQKSYDEGVTDEFLLPHVMVATDGSPVALIKNNDAVISFNFRTDRCREITEALTQESFPEQDMHPLHLHYVTMTRYDDTYKNVSVLFSNDNLPDTLGEAISKAGLRQIRIAETEKYPHVTFFFSGGREDVFPGERRLMAPSPKDVATYDLKPEMSAPQITAMILPEIEAESAEFIVLNFANADMVGHTGVWAAAVKAAETVDACVGQIVPVALEHGYDIFLTADHGNSDLLVNEDGSPNTAHTLNPVPLFLISNHYKGRLKTHGTLADLAPTILHTMGLPVPKLMTGRVLTEE